MISNPKNGWCDFKLGDFVGRPSYLTDVPMDLLDAFISYFRDGCGICWFDEEGTEFTLVLKHPIKFILEERESIKTHRVDLDVYGMAKELISDIELCPYVWCIAFMHGDVNYDSIEKRMKDMEDKIEKLKKIIAK